MYKAMTNQPFQIVQRPVPWPGIESNGVDSVDGCMAALPSLVANARAKKKPARKRAFDSSVYL